MWFLGKGYGDRLALVVENFHLGGNTFYCPIFVGALFFVGI